MLKFLIDESVGRKVSIFMRERGFDVKYVGDENQEASDKEVLDLAQKEKRILITSDKDFGEFLFRLNEPSHGVILLRLKKDIPSERQKYITKIIEMFSQRIELSFIVVTEGKVRIKKLKR